MENIYIENFEEKIKTGFTFTQASYSSRFIAAGMMKYYILQSKYEHAKEHALDYQAFEEYLDSLQ